MMNAKQHLMHHFGTSYELAGFTDKLMHAHAHLGSAVNSLQFLALQSLAKPGELIVSVSVGDPPNRSSGIVSTVSFPSLSGTAK